MYCQRQCNNSINRIHERKLRIAYNDYISPFVSLLEKDDSVTIHQRNILTLALEIFKTENGLNPSFMKNICCPTQHNYITRNKCFAHPNPRTVTYGIESFGYKATNIWNSIPCEIQAASDVTSFITLLSEIKSKLCHCNLCKNYVANVGYITVAD